MKRLSLLSLVLALHFLSRADTSSTINSKALENLVFMSAYIQGKWPAVTSATLGDTTSVAALDRNLDLIAIAQTMSRQHGEEILAKLESDPCKYAELGFRYAKYSDCPLPTKLEILERVLQTGSEPTGSLIKGMAAFELLKHLVILTPDRIEVTSTHLVQSLKKYKADQVAVDSYWRLLLTINEQMEHDPTFAQIVKNHFPRDLFQDIDKASMQLSEDPNFYGVRLYNHVIYDIVPANVRDFWCRIWKCD